MSAPNDEVMQLLGRISDESLRHRLTAHVDALRAQRRFGLVFDRKLPEAVRLPAFPIRVGARVVRRDQSTPDTWRVTGFAAADRAVSRCRPLALDRGRYIETGDEVEIPTAALVVVRDYGETIHPGLVAYDAVARGDGSDPWHTVIEGENLHALQVLRATHRSKIDLIYIDPPYNTGNKGWIYNDRYVDEVDSDRSSKWLSFIERRLLIARELLAPTGILIVAIGDEEHHRLRMLLDQIMGRSNFISDVVWQGGRKNDSRYVSNGADYMLIYARDEPSLSSAGVRWREAKPGLAEALAKSREIWEFAGGDVEQATSLWRQWMRDFKKRPEVTDAVSRYTSLDESTGEPIFTGQNISWPGGGGPRYDLLHPVTGKPVKVPRTGWRYKHTDMLKLIEQRRVRFGADETSGVQGVSYLTEMSDWVAGSTFDVDRRRSPLHLDTVLGEKRFPFPKDHQVLMRWIRLALAGKTDGIVLDFFGGSGSTMEAVLRLNAEDGGNRQCILVTNNELNHKDAAALRKKGFHPGDPEFEKLGVFRHVAHPRIKTVVTGVREDGSVYDEGGLAANVAFYTLNYLDPAMVRKAREFAAISPILWMQAGGRGPVLSGDKVSDGYAVTASYGVLFDPVRCMAQFAEAAQASGARALFVVTDDEVVFDEARRNLPLGASVQRLYESYLRNFEVNTATPGALS